jgi:hypothetical protein
LLNQVLLVDPDDHDCIRISMSDIFPITLTSNNVESRVVTLPTFFPQGFLGGLMRMYLEETNTINNILYSDELPDCHAY